MSLLPPIQYSDYFNKSWRNDSSALGNDSSVGGGGPSLGLLGSSSWNETYEVYAPNFPYVSSTEEQNYIELLSERIRNGSASNQSLQPLDDHQVVGECTSGYPASLYFELISYFLYVLIFVTAVIGNSIVLFIVQSNPRMRTVTNYFITNLAIGDLMMMLFCVPFTFISTFVLQYWPFGLFMCRLVNYTQAVSVLVSAYTLVAISGDRYIAIMWPLKPRITKTCSKVLIGIVWIIALITAAPIAIFSTLVFPTPWHTVCNLPICQESWPSAVQEGYYSTTLLMTQFVIPLLVLIYTYTRIAIVVWGKRPPGEAENSRDQRMAKSKRKPAFIGAHLTTAVEVEVTSSDSGMTNMAQHFCGRPPVIRQMHTCNTMHRMLRDNTSTDLCFFFASDGSSLGSTVGCKKCSWQRTILWCATVHIE